MVRTSCLIQFVFKVIRTIVFIIKELFDEIYQNSIDSAYQNIRNVKFSKIKCSVVTLPAVLGITKKGAGAQLKTLNPSRYVGHTFTSHSRIMI